SKYWDLIPKVPEFTLNLEPYYGSGYLEVKPQEGPQTVFISCMAGTSGQPKRDEDFPLIFYGGAK
ncbi:hypothetical protein NVP1170O_001, partial [Vibrio phage 1.170.O._10N.261.52.C3]